MDKQKGRQVIVYEDERRAGLAEVLQDPSHSCVTFASLVEPIQSDELEKFQLAVSESALAVANVKNNGLYPLKTLLVSTGWNNNDDVFDHVEVWAARHTPEDKPFNLEHDERNIIGHITDNITVNDKLQTIADDSNVEDLPGKFHIVTGAVLYTAWADKDREEKINNIIKEIAKGEWFVSMECWFSGFDYSLKRDNEIKIVARDRSTAYLTKHLLRYGGKGEYEGYRVGRLMRNIVFSGKGLVRRPANKQSIIFTDSVKTLGSIQTININKVIQKVNSESESITMPTSEMPNTNELARELAEVKLSLSTSETKQQLIATELKQKSEKLSDTETKLSDASTRIAKTEIERDNAISELTSVKAELEKVRREVTRATRIRELMTAGLAENEAKVKADKFLNVDDATFAEFVETIASLKRPDMEDDVDSPLPIGEKGALKVQDQKIKKGKTVDPYQDKTADAADDNDDDDDDDDVDGETPDEKKKIKDGKKKNAKSNKSAKSAKVKQKKNTDDTDDNDDDDTDDDDYDSESDASELETADDETDRISLAADLEDENSSLHAFASFIGKEVWSLDSLN